MACPLPLRLPKRNHALVVVVAIAVGYTRLGGRSNSAPSIRSFAGIPLLLWTTRCSLYTTRRRLAIIASHSCLSVLGYTYLLPSASPAACAAAIQTAVVRGSCMSLVHTRACIHVLRHPHPVQIEPAHYRSLRPDPSAPSPLPACLHLFRRVDDYCAPPASPSRVARFVDDCRASLACTSIRCRRQLQYLRYSQLTDAASSPAAHHHLQHQRSRHQHHHRR